jgi:drug/metabolite transporter (DMT)-like permease
VAAAVLTRASCTALFLLVLMKLQRVPFAIPRRMLARAAVVGILVAMQSYCLYSAVALIPAALALLVFQASPMLYVLLSWATGKEAPRLNALAAMLVALFGLGLALDIGTDRMWPRWAELGAGVSWAFGAGVSFALVLYSNAHWLPQVDGRLRTLVMTGVAAAVVLVAGAGANVLVAPQDALGWLGLALLTVFYGAATIILFLMLPRLSDAVSTMALNFEPIALLALAWIFLGQAVTPQQTIGVFVVVGAIAFLGALKR